MAESAINQRGTPRLVMDSPAGARKTLARLSRMRFRGEIASDVFRDLVYAISTLRAYDALIADLRIEERIAKLEEIAESMKGGN